MRRSTGMPGTAQDAPPGPGQAPGDDRFRTVRLILILVGGVLEPVLGLLSFAVGSLTPSGLALVALGLLGLVPLVWHRATTKRLRIACIAVLGLTLAYPFGILYFLLDYPFLLVAALLPARSRSAAVLAP